MLKSLLFSFLLGTTLLIADTIRLPEPNRKGGMPIMEALANRKSSRDFSENGAVSKQEISELLWAANGFNREKGRTAPSAMGAQAIEIYLCNAEGIWLYLPITNELELVKPGDFRAQTGMQEFVTKATFNLLFVYDKTKYTKGEFRMDNAVADATAQAENIYLYCAANNLKTVLRGSVQRDALKKALSLPDSKLIILAQSVGR